MISTKEGIAPRNIYFVNYNRGNEDWNFNKDDQEMGLLFPNQNVVYYFAFDKKQQIKKSIFEDDVSKSM